jgi:hypothetical protein
MICNDCGGRRVGGSASVCRPCYLARAARKRAKAPMNNPDYRRGWTPERRKAASEASKRRWAERRAKEEQERHAAQERPSGRLRRIRYAKSSEMQEIATRWHRLKAEVEEIDTTLKLIDQINPVLRKYQLAQG